MFVLPLLLSPVLAIALTSFFYPLLHRARRRLGVTEQTCFCVGEQTVEVAPAMQHAAAHRTPQREDR